MMETSIWNISGPFPDTGNNEDYMGEILNDDSFIKCNDGILNVILQ